MSKLINKTKKENVIILGAGAPHRGNKPSVLWQAGNNRFIMNWILDALDFPILEINFVAGYKAQSIVKNFPNIKYSINKDWHLMSSTGSLLCQDIDQKRPLIVCYGDILFRKSTVKKLLSSQKSIAIVWDSKFYKKNTENNELKLLEKVQVFEDNVLRVGSDIENEYANGIFVGLIRLQPDVLRFLNKLDKRFISKLKSEHLSYLIEFLRLKGFSIEAIDINGDWAELTESIAVASFILGSKAKTLKRLQKIVKNSIIKEQISFTKENWDKNKLKIISSIKTVLGFKKDLIVRSSSQNEDGFNSANAGKYKSILGVNTNQESILNAVNEVIKSFGDEVDQNDEVLVQPMLEDVIVSGVAFTRTLRNNSPWYVINYSEGDDTTSITSGKNNDHKTFLIKKTLNYCIKEPLWMQNLLEALKEIEKLLVFDSLDIEFAIDSKNNVYILQVRPLAQTCDQKFSDNEYKSKFKISHKNWKKFKECPPHIPGSPSPLYGLMPDWNPAEIIGTSPGELALSLYKYLITNEIWAQQREEFGYRDVRPGPLLVTFMGKPYVDVRLSFCSFIPKTISEELAGKLLNFYLDYLKKNKEFHDKVEFKVVPTCFSPNFKKWENLLSLEAKLNPDEINDLKKSLLNITNNAFPKPKLYLEKINELKRKNLLINSSNLDHLEKARILLEDCKKLRTLPFSHLARCAFIAVTLLNDSVSAGIISTEAKDSFLNGIRTVSHEFTNDGQKTLTGELSWEEFVNKYGHLRPGTYDINSPRYDSNNEYYLKNSLKMDINSKDSLSSKSWEKEKYKFFDFLKKSGINHEPNVIEDFLYKSIEGREYAKFVFTKNLSDSLEELVLSGKEFNLKREDLANLDIYNILKLRDCEVENTQLIENLKIMVEQNKDTKEILSYSQLPSLICSKDELDMFFLNSSVPNFVGSKIINSKFIEINDEEFDEKISLKNKIVLIKRADPGYDWLFAQNISGLITLYGGANSHMAIRSAEFDLTAAIGVGEKIYYKLSLSKVIHIDPINKIIQGL